MDRNLQETYYRTTSAQTEEKKDSNILQSLKRKDCKYFLICESCFWCASCFDQSSIEVCPSCLKHRVESIPLSNEMCEFQYDEKRGVTLEFMTTLL